MSTHPIPKLTVFDGLAAFLGGIHFVATTPRTWRYAAVPAAVMLLLSIVFIVLGLLAMNWIADRTLPEPTTRWQQLGIAVTQLLLVGSVLTGGVLLALLLAQPLSGFALEAIARLQEQALTGYVRPGPSMISGTLHGLRISLVVLPIGLLSLGVLLIIGILIPPAALITVPTKFIVTAWLLGWDFHDYPLGLRGIGLRARLRWMKENLRAVTVLGALWSLCCIFPGVVLLVLPLGVAGATRLVVERERRGTRHV